MNSGTLIMGMLGIVLLSSFISIDKRHAFTEKYNNLNSDLDTINKDYYAEDVSLLFGDSMQTREDMILISEETLASYYHDKFTGRKTASGLIFDNSKYTAAHRWLPFGTRVKVTNLKNKKHVVLTIIDRGPFIKGREIDLTKKAFMEIAENDKSGVLEVKIERLVSIGS